MNKMIWSVGWFFSDLASSARLLWVSSGGWEAKRVLWFLTGWGDGDLQKNTNQFGFTAVWTFPPLQRKRSFWHKKKKSYEHAGLIFVFWYYGIIIRSQNSIYLLIITQPHNQDDCGWYPSNMNVVRELQLFTDFILFYISFGTGIVSILIRICIFSSLQNKMDSLIQFHLGLGDRFCIGDLRTENYENFKLKLQKNLNHYFKEDINPYMKFKKYWQCKNWIYLDLGE